MEQEIIKLLDSDLECIRYKIKKVQIIFEVHSVKKEIPCPYCGKLSSKVHLVYQREIQDTPVHDKQTILLLDARKMFCDNSEYIKPFRKDLILSPLMDGKQTGLLIRY